MSPFSCPKKHLDSDSPSNPDGIDTYVHYFYNSGWQILETRETATESDQPEDLQPKYQHVWSPRYIDAPILRDENTDANGLCDDQRLYYLNDANFNVTTLVDSAGDAVERYVYSPYGKATIYDGTWSSMRSTSSYDDTVLYTGREYDPETGLYEYRNRYYSAELGTFVSRDPIGYEAKDVNLYEYVFGSPLDTRDPSGSASVGTCIRALFECGGMIAITASVCGCAVTACASTAVPPFVQSLPWCVSCLIGCTALAPGAFFGCAHALAEGCCGLF